MRQLISAALAQISCLPPASGEGDPCPGVVAGNLEGASGHARARAAENHPLEVEHEEHDAESSPARRAGGRLAPRVPDQRTSRRLRPVRSRVCTTIVPSAGRSRAAGSGRHRPVTSYLPALEIGDCSRSDLTRASRPQVQCPAQAVPVVVRPSPGGGTVALAGLPWQSSTNERQERRIPARPHRCRLGPHPVIGEAGPETFVSEQPTGRHRDEPVGWRAGSTVITPAR